MISYFKSKHFDEGRREQCSKDVEFNCDGDGNHDDGDDDNDTCDDDDDDISAWFIVMLIMMITMTIILGV